MIFNETKYNHHWDTKKLNETGNFSRGKSRHRPRDDKRLFDNGKYPLIQTGEVKSANLYIEHHDSMYGEFGLAQSKLWDAGTLCITIAANIAETGILAYPMCFPDSVVGFNAFPDKSSELFMHYVFTYIKKSIQGSVRGSIQDNINIDYLSQLDFKIPKKDYQDKIVDILSSIDRKISINNKIKNELESIAKIIYDYWFTQFDFPDKNGNPYKTSGGKMKWNSELGKEIPEDWEVKPISGVSYLNTCSINPLNSPDQTFRYYNIPDFDAIGTYVIEEGKNIKSNKYLVDKNDLLISKLNPRFNRVIYVDDEAICSTEFIPFRLENKQLKNYMYTIAISGNFINYCSVNARGTSNSHKRVDPEVMGDFRVCYNKGIAERFGEIFDNMIQQIILGIEENQKLIALRDFLLPLLINGQIKIVQ